MFPPLGLPRFAPLAPLSAAINHLLKQEPWARERLQAHSGKTLKFVMAPFELHLTVTAEGYVELAPGGAEHAVQIELPLAALPELLGQAFTPGAPAITRRIRLDGDAEFAQTVSFLVQNLRWEFEEDLSRIVGDAAAHGIAGSARSLVAATRSANEKLAANVAEYLLEEDPQLVRPRKIEALAKSVRTLRDDVARIEKRIDRLFDRGR